MKNFYVLALCFLYLFFTSPQTAKAQAGYVVLNEYMPWTTNTCTVNGEFIELYNFGPGPVNLGCYVITEGDFSITIPPNTILSQGEFFILGGQDVLPDGCANINKAIPVNLNWATCNCTSGAIPATGDALLTDGGSADEQIILFNPNLKVVDAVVRNMPGETSSVITTNDISGNCTSHTYDLDTMAIPYETIGESAGRGNSFARKRNGDCNWEKDPQQSGGATNNTSGSSSSLTSVMSITNADACNNDGSVSVSFTGVNDYSGIFPVNYILAKDVDSNSVYDFTDTYTHGIDSTAPTVSLTGLAPGRYRLVLEPAAGCNYQFFAFTLLAPCNITLNSNEFSFYATRIDKAVQLTWTTNKADEIQKFEIEKSKDGIQFKKINAFNVFASDQAFRNFKYFDVNDVENESYYRIKILYRNDIASFSQMKRVLSTALATSRIILFPNPSTGRLNVNYNSKSSENILIQILNADGTSIKFKTALVYPGSNTIPVTIEELQPGIYLVKIINSSGTLTIKKIFKK